MLAAISSNADLDPENFELEGGAEGYIDHVMIPAVMADEGARIAELPGKDLYAVVGAGATTKGLKGAVKTVKKSLKQGFGDDYSERTEHRLNGDASAMDLALAALAQQSKTKKTVAADPNETDFHPDMPRPATDREAELYTELDRLNLVQAVIAEEMELAATPSEAAEIAPRGIENAELILAVCDELDAISES